MEASSGSVAVRKPGVVAPNLSISRLWGWLSGPPGALSHLYVGKVFPYMAACSSTHNHEVSLSHDRFRFVLQPWWNAFDQIEWPSRPEAI